MRVLRWYYLRKVRKLRKELEAMAKESVMVDWETSGVNLSLQCKCGALGIASGKGITMIKCHACETEYRLPHLIHVYRHLDGRPPEAGVMALTEPATNTYDPSDDVSLI